MRSLLTFAVLVSATMPVVAQPVPRAFREAFVVETDATAEKKLAAVAEYVEQERWDAVVALLREVAAAEPRSTIRVSPRRSVSLPRYCDILLTQLPAAGLAVYRQGIDPQAAAWLADADATGDERPLRSIAERAFASSLGDQAVFCLAERAWERGEFDLARDYATRLVPVATPAGAAPLPILRSPHERTPQEGGPELAAVRARLILCSIALGEHDRAAQELEAFRELHPDATGRLAGQQGRLTELLTDLLAAAVGQSSADDRGGWDELPKVPATHTLGATPHRSGRLTQAPAITLPGWQRSLPTEKPTFPAMETGDDVLSRFPVVWKEHVFVADAERIYGFDLESGNAAWSIDNDDPGVLYPPVAPPTAAEVALDRIGGPRRPSPTIGVPRHTLTVHRDRLYARIGSAVTAWPTRELRRPESTIVCLDLSREGLLAWSLSATALGEDDEHWSFEGTPTAVGDRLFLLASRGRPQAQLNALCLDAATGTVLWNRRVGSPITSPPEGAVVMTHRLVTVAAGRLYLQTDHGAVVCLDAGDGRPVWIGWYESRPPAHGNGTARTDHARANHESPSACLFSGGVVVAAPVDSDRLLAYDAASGIELWSRTIRGGGRTLIGAHDGRLVVSGQRLWCLDLFSGRELWSAGYEDPPGAGAGQGLLAGNSVYWPTREDLLVVDLETGTVRQRLPLKQRFGLAGGGNLAAGDGHLILARPDSLAAFFPVEP